MKAQGLSELANLAGVSLTTASRALNHHPYVSDRIRRKVFDAARRLNYMPRSAARRPRIGVITSRFGEEVINFYRNALLAELGRQCGAADIGMEIISPDNLELLEENFVRVALLIQNPWWDTDGRLAGLRNTQLIGINCEQDNIPCVATDDRACIELGMNYLYNRGYRRIALVMPRDDSSANVACRVNCFRDAATRLGTEPLLAELGSDPVTDLEQVLREQHTDAFFVGGEDLIFKVNLALYRLRIKVPDEVALLTFEAPGASEFMTPPMTAVAQNFPELVARALALAQRCFDGETLPKDHYEMIGGLFRERESVRDR